MARSDGAYQAEEKFGTRQERQGLKSLRENSVLEGHGISRDVPSLRDSPLNRMLPGTPVPGYRLCRPSGTAPSGHRPRLCSFVFDLYNLWLDIGGSWKDVVRVHLLGNPAVSALFQK
jgi:hypothetical protein